MKEVFINDDNLSVLDLDYEVIRVKAVLVNKDSNIVLIHNNNTYQFPGGHLEKGEDIKTAIKREILEETGIKDVNINEPFLLIKTYAKNYFNSGKNVCNKIYYYLVFSNEEVSINEEFLDEVERQSAFSIVYVLASRLKEFLEYQNNNNAIDRNIFKEMMIAEYYLPLVKDRNT